MYLKTKGRSYIVLSTTNNITMYKYTSIDGNLTIGNTSVNYDLTITGDFTYTGDGSYTNSEIDNLLDLEVNTTGNTTINEDLTVTCNLTFNGDSTSDSYTNAEAYAKLFLKVN